MNTHTSTVDMVNRPPHYTQGGTECFDIILASQGQDDTAAFCIGNALKYIYRHKLKNGIEDIQKAIWYLNKYLEIKGA